MGTKNIWLIDPAKKSIFIWGDGDWIETNEKLVPVTGSASMYLDMAWVWQEVADSQ